MRLGTGRYRHLESVEQTRLWRSGLVVPVVSVGLLRIDAFRLEKRSYPALNHRRDLTKTQS